MLFDEALKETPAFIRRRFGALNSYVRESLFPAQDLDRLSRRRELPRFFSREAREVVDEATTLVFVFALYKMFLHGSEAAKETVDILEELNVPGFRLGSTLFEGRNENVLLGERLAGELLNSLDPKARRLVLESQKIYQIIDMYRPIAKELRG